MRQWLLLFSIIYSSLLYSQTNRQKLDSLAAEIDRSHKATKHWQDSFLNVQDSLRQRQLKQVPEKEVDVKQEKKKQLWLPLAGAAIVLLVLLPALIRKRKKKQAT